MLEPLPDWMHDTELVHAALLLPVLLVSGPTLFRGGSIDHRIWVFGATAFALLSAALLMHSEQLENTGIGVWRGSAGDRTSVQHADKGVFDGTQKCIKAKTKPK